MDSTQSFTDYLKDQKLEYSTIKNYRSDCDDFFSWIETIDPSLLSPEQWYRIDIQTIESYKKMSLSRSIPPSTLNRRLSSLRKFFEFAIQRRFTLINPAKDVSNIDLYTQTLSNEEKDEQERESYIDGFRHTLEKSDQNEITVKNYLSDINQFLLWLHGSKMQQSVGVQAAQD